MVEVAIGTRTNGRGKDHGSIIMGGMTNVFQFFGQHTEP